MSFHFIFVTNFIRDKNPLYGIHNNTYLCMYVYICTTDRPLVQITSTTGGCNYVSVSWTTAGSSDVCAPVQYNVTLSSSIVNMAAVVTSMNTYHFNGLPNDTQFTVTVIGINVMGLASDPVSASVVTMGVCESMCIAKCLTVCMYSKPL